MESGKAENNSLILDIIDKLKDGNPVEREHSERLKALEVKDETRERDIKELKEYNKNKEDKRDELKKFNFTKLFAILGFILGAASFIVNLLDKIF